MVSGSGSTIDGIVAIYGSGIWCLFVGRSVCSCRIYRVQCHGGHLAVSGNHQSTHDGRLICYRGKKSGEGIDCNWKYLEIPHLGRLKMNLKVFEL